MSDISELLRKERTRFPILEKYAYFETAGTGLIPDYVYEAVKKYQEDRYRVGGDCDWGGGKGTLAMMAESKENLAGMLHCSPDDIAFGQNSSQMFTLFSEGLRLGEGDNVILTDNAWISTRFTWQIREKDGVEIRYARTRDGAIAPEEITALADGRTRAICLSMVESSSGFRQDMKPIGRFCGDHGIFLAVDGVQALGVLPVNVEETGIDFLVGNDYKWMMHYCGTGYAYVRPELRNRLRQWGAGWMSDSDRFNTAKRRIDLREDAGRYELGYPTVSGIYALGLVAARYLALGEGNIEKYVLDLTDYLYAEVERIPGASVWMKYPRKNRSTIANILLSDELAVTSEKLLANGVFAHAKDGSAFGADTMIRISLHYYNDGSDIDRLCSVLRKCAKL